MVAQKNRPCFFLFPLAAADGCDGEKINRNTYKKKQSKKQIGMKSSQHLIIM